MTTIIDKIVGKKIVNVEIKNCQNKDYLKEDSIVCDSGDIFIYLDDGTVLRFWNSEWGGIEVVKEEKTIEKQELFKLLMEINEKLNELLKKLGKPSS